MDHQRYLSGVGLLIRRSALALVALALFWSAGAWLFKILPAGFLPDEDQAAFFVPVRLPDGASIDRTDAAVAKIEERLAKVKGVDDLVRHRRHRLHHADQRLQRRHHHRYHHSLGRAQAKDLQLNAILARAQRASADVPEAFTTVFGFPPILGLSNTGGFQFMLEDRAGGEFEQLGQRRRCAGGRGPQTSGTWQRGEHVPRQRSVLQHRHESGQAADLGVPVTDAYNTLQTFLGGLYVNDFNRFGHTWQVLIQAEPEFRNQPSDINRFYVRSVDGNMVPLGTLASVKPTTGPEVVFRYNRFRAIQILGSPAPGVSSGQAVDAMEKVAAQTLPTGYGYEWTGTTYQQKLAQGHEGVIFGFAAVLVFLVPGGAV